MLAGSVAAALAAYVCVRFLARYVRTNMLLPVAVHSLVAGLQVAVRFALGG